MVRAYLPQNSPKSVSSNTNTPPQGSITIEGVDQNAMLYETLGTMQYETGGNMEYETE